MIRSRVASRRAVGWRGLEVARKSSIQIKVSVGKGSWRFTGGSWSPYFLSRMVKLGSSLEVPGVDFLGSALRLLTRTLAASLSVVATACLPGGFPWWNLPSLMDAAKAKKSSSRASHSSA